MQWKMWIIKNSGRKLFIQNSVGTTIMRKNLEIKKLASENCKTKNGGKILKAIPMLQKSWN